MCRDEKAYRFYSRTYYDLLYKHQHRFSHSLILYIFQAAQFIQNTAPGHKRKEVCSNTTLVCFSAAIHNTYFCIFHIYRKCYGSIASMVFAKQGRVLTNTLAQCDVARTLLSSSFLSIKLSEKDYTKFI